MGERVPARAPDREQAGVVIVASAAVVVSVSVIAAGFGVGAPWVFEALAAFGVLVGLGVAFGVFDRGRARQRSPRGRGDHEPTPELSATVDAELRALDPVEHRRLDLGAPWPTVVVGPTGVTVIAVAGQVGGASEHRLRTLLAQVRRHVRTGAGDRAIEVRALLVVPDDRVPAVGCGDVRTVAAANLASAVARGSIVPMATVTALFAELSGQLAPDLAADAV